VVEVSFVPSVIALLERREARAREELDAWQELLREAQEQVNLHRERVECARIGREEVLRALAEEAEVAMLPLPSAVTAPVPVPEPEAPVSSPSSESVTAAVDVREPAVPAASSDLRGDYDPGCVSSGGTTSVTSTDEAVPGSRRDPP
jgi:hypothetical protein